MALPPPDYEDAVRYPETSTTSSRQQDREATHGRRLQQQSDSLPSYHAVCSTQQQGDVKFSLKQPECEEDKTTGEASKSLSPRVSRSSSAAASALLAGQDGDPTDLDGVDAHDVSIHVTTEELADEGVVSSTSSVIPTLQSDVSVPASSLPHCEERGGSFDDRATLGVKGGSSVDHANPGVRGGSSDDRATLGIIGASSVDQATLGVKKPSSASSTMNSLHSSNSSFGRLGNITKGTLRPGPASDDVHRARADTLERRVSDSTHPFLRPSPCGSQDLSLPGLRSHRSCSDAGVHIASRSRAAAVAVSARSSSLVPGAQSLMPHGHRQVRASSCGHHRHHCHRSHSCIPGHYDQGSNGSVHNGHTCGRRAHSHSSVARLGVKGHHREDSSSTLRSQRASSEEEEVTYVWKDGRVQVHHARSGLTTPDLSVSGQQVQYMWRNGNVQKVVRGSNHELLSAEVVPPRGEVKGVNYCIVFGVMALFVICIVTLIFLLRAWY